MSRALTPVVLFLIAFVVFAVVLLSDTPFGRRVYGIGNGIRVARLSGIAVGRMIIGVYILSGALLGACRHSAHWLFRAGKPRHGR